MERERARWAEWSSGDGGGAWDAAAGRSRRAMPSPLRRRLCGCASPSTAPSLYYSSESRVSVRVWAPVGTRDPHQPPNRSRHQFFGSVNQTGSNK